MGGNDRSSFDDSASDDSFFDGPAFESPAFDSSEKSGSDEARRPGGWEQVNDLILAVHIRLVKLSLPPLAHRGVFKRLARVVKRTPAVYYKQYGIVVSDASLANYRGSSLTVETPVAELIVATLREIAAEVENCSRPFKRYLFGRLAQALNDEKPHTPEAIVLCLAGATKVALQAPQCPDLAATNTNTATATTSDSATFD